MQLLGRKPLGFWESPHNKSNSGGGVETPLRDVFPKGSRSALSEHMLIHTFSEGDFLVLSEGRIWEQFEDFLLNQHFHLGLGRFFRNPVVACG